MDNYAQIRITSVNGCRLCGPGVFSPSARLELSPCQLICTTEGEQFSLFYTSLDTVRLIDNSTDRRSSLAPASNTCVLCLYTKMFCVYELSIPNASDARLICQSLESLSNSDLAAFQRATNFRANLNSADQPSSCTSDFKPIILQTNRWRMSSVNAQFKACSTYPNRLCVPKEVTDAMLLECSAFRRGGRFPLLVYYHESRQTGLLIASEPLPQVQTNANVRLTSAISGSPLHSGISISSNPTHTSPSSSTSGRCRSDEQFLTYVLPDRFRGTLLDLRTSSSSKRSAPLQGGQSDCELFYPQWRRVARPIESAATIAVTFQKFIEVCVASSNRNSRMSSTLNTKLSTNALVDSLGLLSLVGNTSSDFSGTNTDSSKPNPKEPVDVTGDKNSDKVTATTSSNTQVSHKTRRISAWLSVVREVLAAAVAGATALDARDSFAHQQLQQEQCLQAQKIKDGAKGSSHRPSEEPPKLRGSYVLVQSTCGFDRALVVAAIIQVILNPHCRSISGFQQLIQHTWLDAGYPFAERCRYVGMAGRSLKNEAPMFVLFLDCVWQLWRQYPSAFEFTDEFLCLLVEHVYSSEFGTFLCNCAKERLDIGLSEKTESLWSYLERTGIMHQYVNPIYSNQSVTVNNQEFPQSYACWPCLAPQALDVWSETYHRQHFTQPQTIFNFPRQLTGSLINEYRKEVHRVHELRKMLESLQSEAVSAGLLT